MSIENLKSFGMFSSLLPLDRDFFFLIGIVFIDVERAGLVHGARCITRFAYFAPFQLAN